MIPTTLDHLEDESVPVFITQEARQLAQGFAGQQPNPTKSDQVYRNTLAVCLVNNYLRVLGLSTDLTACDSWNPMLRMAVNTADLDIVGQGRIECRPVSTAELNSDPPTCYVPTEVQRDRLGYVIVHLQDDCATLLGFTPMVDAEYFPLEQLQPFSELFPLLHRNQMEERTETLTTLSQWFQNAVQTGWQTLDTLLEAQPEPRVAIQFRRSAATILQRGKILAPLSDNADNASLMILIVELKRLSETGFEIKLLLQPLMAKAALPTEFNLRLSDEAGVTLMEVTNTGSNTNSDQHQVADTNSDQHQVAELCFQADEGDRFNLHIQAGETILVEKFVV